MITKPIAFSAGNNMNKFDLNSLPKCGAKTRSGEPCKRFGNKRNGRCKLHGGKSTGAKSKDGKLITSKNAVKHYGNWLHNRFDIKIETQNRVNDAVQQLVKLANYNAESKLTDEQLLLLFNEFRIDLEALKYGVLDNFGAEVFILVQSALDRFYKIADAPHMKFHVLSPMVNPPYFSKEETAAQTAYDMKLIYRLAARPLKDVFKPQ